MRQNQASIPGGREGIEDAYTVTGKQADMQSESFSQRQKQVRRRRVAQLSLSVPTRGGRPVLFCPEKALFPFYNSPTNLVCSKNISSPPTHPPRGRRKEEAPPPPSANPMKVCGGITTTKKRDCFLSFSSGSTTKTKTRPTSSSRFQTRENNVLIPPTHPRKRRGRRPKESCQPACLQQTHSAFSFPFFLPPLPLSIHFHYYNFRPPRPPPPPFFSRERERERRQKSDLGDGLALLLLSLAKQPR